jgi:hypothetical protein
MMRTLRQQILAVEIGNRPREALEAFNSVRSNAREFFALDGSELLRPRRRL